MESGDKPVGNSLARTGHVRAVLLAIGLFACFAVIGCTEVVQPTSTPIVFEPTPAPAGTRAQVLAGGDPLLVALMAQPQELPPGNAATGNALYSDLGCTACHTLGADTNVGPGFQGVYARAGTRTELSADDYIVESITRPSAYIVEGYTNVMQVFDYLSDQELADLIAFLKTLE